MDKTYNFNITITDESGDVLLLANTFVLPDSISEFGDCESVDLETGNILRNFKKLLVVQEELKGNEETND